MNKLAEIFDYKRSVASERGSVELGEVRAKAGDVGPTRGFLATLQGSSHRPALIAEVKKASPVFGTIRGDLDPVEVAKAYERAGADCLSVLTDAPYFQGSTENLVQARGATGLPVLRKDFTVSAYDIYEARGMGADAVLLIVNGLEDSELLEYRELAESLGMDVIVEAHSEGECERALKSGAKILGINNRDLETFGISIEVGERLLPFYKGQVFTVSESALHTNADVERVKAAGADAVLIGTAFCSKPDIEEGVREVMGWFG